MTASDIGQGEPRRSHSSSRRSRRPWWKRLMRAMGMGAAQEYQRMEPFRPDIALQLAEAAHRREQELRRGLRQESSATE